MRRVRRLAPIVGLLLILLSMGTIASSYAETPKKTDQSLSKPFAAANGVAIQRKLVTPNWRLVNCSMEANITTMYYPITIDRPGKFTAQIRWRRSARYSMQLAITTANPGYSRIASRDPASKTAAKVDGADYLTSLTTYLEPGEYRLRVRSPEKTDRAFKLRAKLTALSLSELEPNNDELSAQSLVIPQSVKGLSGFYDDDLFRFSVDSARTVTLTMVEQVQPLRFTLYKSGEPEPIYMKQATGSKLVKARTTSKSMLLGVGDYYLAVQNGERTRLDSVGDSVHDQFGTYQLSVKYGVPGPYTLTMGRNMRVSINRGVYGAPKVSIKPASREMPRVTWRSSRPSVAMVNALTGEITPISMGKTVITCVASDGKHKAATTLTVGANEFSRKKPRSGSQGYIYTSAKTLRYEGNELVVEVYVLNRGNRTIIGNIDLSIGIYRSMGGAASKADLVYEHVIGPWMARNGAIKTGKYQVITARIPLTEDNPELQDLDFGSGKYDAAVLSAFLLKDTPDRAK